MHTDDHSHDHDHHSDDQPPAGYLSSQGRGNHLTVQARCTCGWEGGAYPWSATSRSEERHDLAEHLEATGHRRVTATSASEHGVHGRCGHRHGLDDDCAVAYASPAGLLLRLDWPAPDGRMSAADRLEAAQKLLDWTNDKLDDAITAARLAGLDLDAAAALGGISAEEAIRRCRPLLGRFGDDARRR